MDQLVEKRIIRVLASNMGALAAAFSVLEKKAKKIGVQVPTYTVGQYCPAHVLQGSPQDPGANAYGEIYIPAKYEVTVEGEVPKFPGWEFVGTIEHTEHGNILRAMPDKIVPEELRLAKPTCDHCGTTRQRNDTFLVNKEGELKRVGRACLKDYLGGKSPEQIAYLLSLERMMKEFQEEEMRGTGKEGLEIVEFMSHVVAIVAHQGYYISKAKVRESGGSSTSEAAYQNFLDSKSTSKETREKAIQTTEQHTKQALEMLEWVRTRESKSSYDENLRIVSMKPVLTNRDLGLVASIIPSYNYAIGLIQKNQALLESNREAAKTLTYVGEIKKRQYFNLTVKKILKFDGQFGPSSVLLMVDDSGNELVWKTSGTPGCVPQKHTAEDGYETYTYPSIYEGNTYKVKGTVKAHQLYKEKPQTVLTRCSFEDVIAVQIDETVSK